MSNVAGEIYFISEEPSMSAPPMRVKIGLVRESKSGRDSQDRLLDHQTGNPRKLKLIEVVETARVSRVENSLHQRYAGQRGIGEWFELSDSELQAAIAECRDLAAQQAVHLPVIRKADAMKGLVRDEVLLAATEDAMEWHRRFLAADASAKLLKNLIEKYRKAIRLANESGYDVHRYARVELPRVAFGSWLSEHHNAEWEACKQTKTTNSFEVSSQRAEPVLEGVDAELASKFAAKLEEWSLDVGFESLHQLHLQVRRPLSVWSEEKDLSRAYLKVFCGTNQGIANICKWTTKISNNFSAEIAEEKFPLLYEQHAGLEIFGAPKIYLRVGGDGDS